MKISRFATDLGLEEEGVWVDIGEGAQLKVARVGNPRYRSRVRELSKPYKRQIRADILPEDMSDEIVLRAFSETILLDWKGIEDDNGEPIPYSHENAYELLKGLRDFRTLVADVAQEQETFRRVEAEEEGNS